MKFLFNGWIPLSTVFCKSVHQIFYFCRFIPDYYIYFSLWKTRMRMSSIEQIIAYEIIITT